MDREWEKTFDAVPDLIAVLNKDFEIVRINRAMAARLGKTPRECIGKKCHQLVHGRDEPPSFCPHARLMADGGDHAEEVSEPRLRGAFLITVSPLRDNEGQLKGSVHVVRDLSDRQRLEKALERHRRRFEKLMAAQATPPRTTAPRLRNESGHQRPAEEPRREADRRYRIFADNAHDWECWFDPGGSLIYSSPSCLRITGWSPEDFLNDPGLLHRIVHPEDRELLKRHWEECRHDEEDGQDRELEFRIVHRNGRVEWLGHVCQPIFDEEGHRLGVRASNRRITERKEALEEKSRLEAQLLQAQRLEALGTLAGGIAHDFSNILGAISGYVEMALAKLPPTDGERIQRYLRRVLEGAGRAKELTRQLLAFSRPAEQEARPMSVSPLLKEVLKLIRTTLPATIEIGHKIEATADIVLADPGLIHQVAINLLTNAFHALGDRGGRVDIELGNEELAAPRRFLTGELPGGVYLVLTVRDNGPGMTPEVLGRIFNPFFSTKEPGAGTGLGLSVVHGIVRNLGGGIHVESESGVGTEFRIYLPVATRKEAIFEASTTPYPRGKGERVLFVDDDPALVELGQEMLAELGYAVTAHRDSREALADFRAHPDGFDLIVTDQRMPKLTGCELTEEVRKIRPEIPVILCTGYSETALPEKTRALGIDATALKPLTIRALADQAAQVMKAARERGMG
ncbi:MAG: PAS domain-containing protein [Pseudomonadota bacterium]|nr:PAS domain-containing protein [Pseudomonadota bacterium]